MGTSPSKGLKHTTQQESADVQHDGRCFIVEDSDAGSCVFLDQECNVSISSAEDVLLNDNRCYNAANQPQENRNEEESAPAVSSHEEEIALAVSNHEEEIAPAVSSNEEEIAPAVSSNEEEIVPAGSSNKEEIAPAVSSHAEGIAPAVSSNEEDIVPAGSSIEEEIVPAGSSNEDEASQDPPEENRNTQQDSAKVDSRIETRRESEPINIISNLRSVEEESPNQQTRSAEILLRASADSFIPSDINLTGKEEWIQIGGCGLTLFNIYEIFSDYGNISALAKTDNHIYVKFSSWVGVANVFADLKNVKLFHQFDSLMKVEEHEIKRHTDRTEIYMDLPSFVVTYLKEHHELSKALNIVAMTANDNMCVNAPKIQHLLDHLKKSISKGFQRCRVFPFGCHVLGCCDRYAPLEVFVDVGDMYAGCHKQSSEEQIAIAKEIRKLISEDVTWCSDEESPVGVYFHKTVGLRCILSFNNGFGNRCTRLLGVFMDFDERFRILYLMLDIWSKQCSLQGVSNGLNSYIVAVLLVFYLQVLSVPLLPPIHRIRAGRPIVIKGWDCTFIEDADLLPRNECSMELYSLLRGFFVFYGSYDWKRVVCPVLGQSIDRSIFSSPSVPFPEDPVFANYLRALSEKVPNTSQLDIGTIMCVQDFFNLSENVAKGVSPDMLLRFQSLCRQAHKIMCVAESRMSFGSHTLRHISSVPHNRFQMQREDPPANECRHRSEFGSLGDCTTSSRSWGNSDNFTENEHGIRCIHRNRIWSNRRENRPPGSAKLQRRADNEDTRYQPKVIPNTRGRKVVQQNNQSPRSFRGRVFWYNGQKNRRGFD